MLGNKIALIGDTGAAKTTTWAAWKAKYGALPDPPFPDDESVKKLLPLNRTYCTSFIFTGDMTVTDPVGNPLFVDSEDWAERLVGFAKGLRSEPMRYPIPTRIPYLVRADLEFQSYHIGTREKTNNYMRRFTLMDIPGGSLLPTNPLYEKTVLSLNDADALVIFIDMTTADQANSDRSQRILTSIKSIVNEASSNPIFRDRFIPVSILFTKSDRIPREQLARANELFFERYTIPLSRVSQRIQVMSCPVSVEDPVFQLFRPKNIHLPFLFSTMGIIHSEALRAKTVAEEMKKLSWWHRQKQPQSRKSLINQSENDLRLAREIRDTLACEYISGDKNIRYARDGEENFIHQIGFNI